MIIWVSFSIVSLSTSCKEDHSFRSAQHESWNASYIFMDHQNLTVGKSQRNCCVLIQQCIESRSWFARYMLLAVLSFGYISASVLFSLLFPVRHLQACWHSTPLSFRPHISGISGIPSVRDPTNSRCSESQDSSADVFGKGTISYRKLGCCNFTV